jgi:hypothetical protein
MARRLNLIKGWQPPHDPIGPRLVSSLWCFYEGRKLLAGNGLEGQSVGTDVNNSPYLDRPLVPLAIALRSMLAETEAKIATAEPAEKAGLQQRAGVLRDWLTPKTTPLPTCWSKPDR